MHKIELVRQVVDDILNQQPDEEIRRCGFVHLYGVANVCALLALKRGFNLQASMAAGMLHDIWTYKTGDPTDHARLSALEADRILRSLGCFTNLEVMVICHAISHHSDKEELDGEMDELLKDADVLQHYLYNPNAVVAQLSDKSDAWVDRLKKELWEIGVGPLWGLSTKALTCKV